MSLRIALVGCGKIADGHVEEIQKMPERATVVAVCDRELLMAEQMSVRYGIPGFYDSYDKMLAEARPDVVHITTPPGSHLALGRTAIDAGCHVYMEKPLALNAADAAALIEHATRAKKKITVGYTYLFDPPALEMRRLLAEGALGDVVHLESYYGYSIGGQFGAAILGDAQHWVHAMPGKLFQNNIDHVLNKLLEFIDDDEPAIDAFAWRRSPAKYGDVRDEMQEELRVVMRGARVSAYGTFTSWVKPSAQFVRLYGTKNILHADFVSRTVTLEPGATLPSAIGRLAPAFGQAVQFAKQGAHNAGLFARGDFQFFSGLNRLFAMFYDAITSDGPLPISTRDMLRVARWMDRIFALTAVRRGA